MGYDFFQWNSFVAADPAGGDKNSGLQIIDGTFSGVPGGNGIAINLRMYQAIAEDNVTVIHGRHTIKTGGSFMGQGDNGCGSGPAWGSFRSFPNTPIPVDIPTASGATVPAGSVPPALGSFINFLLANPADVYLNFAVPGTAHPCTGRRDIRRKVVAAYVQDDVRATSKLTLNLGLRYEYPTVIKDARGGGSQAALVPSHPLWIGTPAIILNPHPVYNAHQWELGPFGPRVGFAYEIQPNTVIRGGGAIRMAIPPFAAISQAFRSFPNFAIATIPGVPLQFNARQWVPALMAQLPQAQTPSGQGVSLSHPPSNTPTTILPYVPIVGPQIVTNVSADFKSGYIEDWSLTLEHRFPGDIVGSAAYVGSAGVGLLGMGFPFGYAGGNKPPTFLQANGISSVDEMRNLAHSTYHGLQATVRKISSAQGINVEASYTWSKAIDNMSEAYFQGNLGTPQDPFKQYLEKGPAPFDATHRLVVNFVQQLMLDRIVPSLPSRLIKGWEISGVLQAQTGTPFTVVSGRIIDGRGLWLRGGTGGARPDQVGSTAAPPGSDKTTWFDPSAFSVPILANGFQARSGFLGRNTMRSPGFAQFDFGFHKDTAITERVSLQIRMDAINIFNHTNLGAPVNNWSATGVFGRIFAARDSRNIQLGTKILF